jgi:L-seryl-tRNA(Ser) seleniumtransferase
MKNEIILHRAHLVNYEHNYRAAGAKQVHIGNVSTTHEWELESAFNENTAAVAYIIGPQQGGALPLPKVVEMAHDRGVPVIVDAAGMLPPVENLTRFVEMGADMVSFSGGKGVLGPQSTGILCGRQDLIEAAYLNSAPSSTSVGRAAKVCKEEIAGLVTALEIFVDTDHQAVAAAWRAKCRHIVSELQGIPGVGAELMEATPEYDEYESSYPRAFVLFDRSWNGPDSTRVIELLKDGDPSIRVREAGFTGGISIIPVALQDGEEEIIAQRMRGILTGAG